MSKPKPVGSCTLPSFSLWEDGKLDRMVQRTFIHAPPTAQTSSFSSIRRSSSMGELSGSTSARSSASSCANLDLSNASAHQDVGFSERIVRDRSQTPGTTDPLYMQTSMVPTAQFVAPCFTYTMPMLGGLASFPPCPPPPLPPVLRLSDHFC